MTFNVLQVLPRLESGGVERGTLEIASALVNDGHGSFVASNGGKMVRQLVDSGSEHIAMSLHSKNPIIIIWNGWRLAKVVKQYGINIIHARSRAPGWSALIASRLTKVKFVTTFHGRYCGYDNCIKSWYNSVMVRGDMVIAVSSFIEDHITRYYSRWLADRKLVMIHRAADLDSFNPDKISREREQKAIEHLGCKSEKRLKILLPGRITRAKGIDAFIGVLAKVAANNWVCYIVGDYTSDHAAYIKELKEKIKLAELTDKVFIKNGWSDMPSLYKVVDIVISSSIIPEAFGRVMVEAQAMGKIIVANNHGGALEIIKNGINGFHMPLHDPDAAADIINNVLALEASSEPIKKAARENCKDFDLPKMCAKTLQQYKYLLGISK